MEVSTVARINLIHHDKSEKTSSKTFLLEKLNKLSWTFVGAFGRSFSIISIHLYSIAYVNI